MQLSLLKFLIAKLIHIFVFTFLSTNVTVSIDKEQYMLLHKGKIESHGNTKRNEKTRKDNFLF